VLKRVDEGSGLRLPMNSITLYLILSPFAPSSSSITCTSSRRTAYSPEVADAVSVLMMVDDPVSDRVDGLSSINVFVLAQLQAYT